MNEGVIEFIKLYLPKLSEAGTAIGGYLGFMAILAGYAIKQALSFFDK